MNEQNRREIEEATLSFNRNTAKRVEACLNACAGIPTEQLTPECLWKLVNAALLARDRGDSTAHEMLRDSVRQFDRSSD